MENLMFLGVNCIDFGILFFNMCCGMHFFPGKAKNNLSNDLRTFSERIIFWSYEIWLFTFIYQVRNKFSSGVKIWPWLCQSQNFWLKSQRYTYWDACTNDGKTYFTQITLFAISERVQFKPKFLASRQCWMGIFLIIWKKSISYDVLGTGGI